LLLQVTAGALTSAEDGPNAFSYGQLDTDDIPLGEVRTVVIPYVPLDDEYHIFFQVTTELSGLVDVLLIDGANVTIREERDVEVDDLHWVVSPDEDAAFVVITPVVAPAGRTNVNLEWRLRVLEDSLVEKANAGQVEEESTPYWTNSKVLLMGIVGSVLAIALLILALQPFRLEPSARNDLGTVRHHQQ
jgi:hypothetical protein